MVSTIKDLFKISYSIKTAFNENKEINDTSKNSYIWIQQENTLTKIEINQIKICK